MLQVEMESATHVIAMQEGVILDDLRVLTQEESKKNEQIRLEAIKGN